MTDVFRTPIGDMRVIEVFLYYDGPKLFSCKDRTGQKYFAILIDESEDGDRWFLIPVSDTRLERVRTGETGLRECVRYPENDWLWDVFIPFDGSKGDASLRYADTLQEHELPGPEATLSLPPRIHGEIQHRNDVEEEAVQSRRDILDITLSTPFDSHKLEVDYLAQVLLRVQSLLFSLATPRLADRGPIPKHVRESNTLMFAGSFVGSVGIRLETKGHATLLDTPAERGLELFMRLLETGGERAQLSRLLPSLSPRAVARYRSLLTMLHVGQLGLKAEWGSPFKGKRSAKLSHEQVRSALAVLEQDGDDMSQVLKVRGSLISVTSDATRRRYLFEFVSMDGDRFKGNLSPQLTNVRFNVPAYDVVAWIEELIELNPATGEEKVTYTLIGLRGMDFEVGEFPPEF
ncbi:DUF6575 domain-containing protein [Hydrogenibacillus schlegelii]|uniref:DUF6575 domain-containing protein n=1 Tax=Hydrogenibacillus schlegelii TaxID=1484 RepID=UPI0023565E99|nr:DUF6575 domain-containing protein [Hydrogenibacillus schlegelii]